MLPWGAARFDDAAALTVSGGGGGGFSPASLSPVGWWEASTSSLFQSNAGTTAAVSNGDVIGFLSDLSGNGNHLKSLADDTTRPTLQGVGVHPVIRFDGVNDLLSCGALNLYNGGSCSIFFAGKVNAGAVNLVVCGEASTANGNPFYVIHAHAVTASTMATQIRNDASASILAGSSPVLASAFGNTDVVLGMTDSGTLVSEYLDQGSAATTAETRSGTLTLNNFSVGGLRRTTINNWMAMDIYGMVCVTSVIGSTNRSSLVTYLGALQGRAI